MTYQTKQGKDPNIKLRLNNLEAEINNIRDVLTKRKAKNVSTAETTYESVAKLTSVDKFKASVPPDRLMVNKDICSYLQNITRHIAKGSEAIRRIASLTEVSSLGKSSGFTPLGYTTSEQESELSELQKKSVSSYYNSGVFNSFSDLSVPGGSRGRIPSAFLENCVHQAGDEKLSTAKPIIRKGVIEVKKQILQENHLLKQKLADENALKNELADLKKKLKEESKKRFTAEKKVEEVQKTLNEMQKPSENEDSAQSDAVLLSVQEKLATLEQKYAEERKQREDLENEMNTVRGKLEESELLKAGLSQTRDIALAVADKLWSRSERRESFMNGQGDGQKYKPYLNKLWKTTVPDEALAIYEKIKEQILAAEIRHKTEKKDPLEDPQVRSLIEKHREAYYDLEKLKNRNEIEQEGKIKYLENSLGQLQQHYNIKTRKLLDRVQELTYQLKSKTEEMEATSEKKADLAVQNLKETAETLEAKNKQQRELLETREETIKKLENELQTFQKQLDEARHHFLEINQLMEGTKSEMIQNVEMMGNMKLEIDGQNEALTIKDKMIADNVDTIKALKMALDTNRRVVEDMKNSNNSLKLDKTRLEKENEKLSKNIGKLEKVVDEANTYKAAQERNLLQLKNLETQVYERQKEWEEQLMRMSNEKDEAIHAARINDLSKIIDDSSDGMHKIERDLNLMDDLILVRDQSVK